MSFTYKYDTHVHSRPASACGLYPPEYVVECYADAGYSGFFLTDHFFNGNCGIDYNLPWGERVWQFTEGFHRAKKWGDKIGFNVFFGYEFNFLGAEFLILNSSEEFLYKNPGLMGWDLTHFLREVRKDGAFVVHAHPCRKAGYIMDPELRLPRHVDAVEVFNASHDPEFNPPAVEYAAKHKLFEFSGSDNHDPEEIFPAGLVFRTNPATAGELIGLVKAGEYKLVTTH